MVEAQPLSKILTPTFWETSAVFRLTEKKYSLQAIVREEEENSIYM